MFCIHPTIYRAELAWEGVFTSHVVLTQVNFVKWPCVVADVVFTSKWSPHMERDDGDRRLALKTIQEAAGLLRSNDETAQIYETNLLQLVDMKSFRSYVELSLRWDRITIFLNRSLPDCKKAYSFVWLLVQRLRTASVSWVWPPGQCA